MNRKQRRRLERERLRDARKQARSDMPLVGKHGIQAPGTDRVAASFRDGVDRVKREVELRAQLIGERRGADPEEVQRIVDSATRIDFDDATLPHGKTLRNEEPHEIKVEVVGKGYEVFVASIGRLNLTEHDVSAYLHSREKLMREREKIGRFLNEETIAEIKATEDVRDHAAMLATIADPENKQSRVFPDARMQEERDFYSSRGLHDWFHSRRPGAKVFHMSMGQYADLNVQNPFQLGIDEVFFIPPFPIYYMKIDANTFRPIVGWDDDPLDASGTKASDYMALVDGMLVDTTDPERWIIAEHVEYDVPGKPKLAAQTTVGIAYWPDKSQVSILTDRPEDFPKIPEGERQYVIKTAFKLLWVAINFMLLINSKEVEHVLVADPARPISRQQRRASGYIDVPHFEIRLKPKATVRVALEQSVREHRKHHKRPHDVRSHPRRYKSGHVAIVKAHRRGIRAHPGEQPLQKEYDATAMGHEIRKAPFEQ